MTMPLNLNPKKIALAAAIFCQGLACAQSLPDVVISASRSAQSSFDAPAAITSVNRDTIEGAGPQVNLSETLNRVPGLTILNRQNYAQDLQVSIRGFGARSAFGIRGVRLLIDGIPATTPDGQGQGSSVSLTSTERLEVLRGPLALLYGNSSGGVIQAFTRDAPAEPEFDAQYYLGSFGMHRSDWQYAGKLGGTGKANAGVGLVADYSTFDTTGFRDNSRTERKQFNAKLSYNLSEQTKFNVVFNRFDMPTAQDPLGLTKAQLDDNPAQAGTNAIATFTRKAVLQNQLGGSLVHKIDANRELSARVYTGTRENLQYQAGNTWVGLNRNYYGLGVQYNAQTEVGSVPVKWVAGYEFDRSRENRQGGAAALGQKIGTPTRNEDNQAENSDLFVQANALLTEQVSVVAGARASTVRFVSEDLYFRDGDGSGNTSFSATSPVLGLTWHVNPALNLYANYGKGFESPTLAEVAYSDTLLAGQRVPAFNKAINAASSRHVELGAKWLPNPISRVDFTIYQIETDDEIVVKSSFGGNTLFQNAPGTKRNGWELTANTLLAPTWRVSLAASAIDATYTKAFVTSAILPTPAPNKIAEGNKLPGIPQSFVFAEMLWKADGFGGGNKFQNLGMQAGLEYTQAGRLYANDINTVSVDGYSILAAKINQSWQLGAGRLTGSLRVDNLTDQRYVGSVIVNQAALQFFEPAPGRNWTLGLKLVWPI
jgi:iron complex outermembrane recepter protein